MRVCGTAWSIQVQDIYCNCCDLYLGWKYEEAFEQSQKVLPPSLLVY